MGNQQKKDVKDYASGYLSHEKLNNEIKKNKHLFSKEKYFGRENNNDIDLKTAKIEISEPQKINIPKVLVEGYDNMNESQIFNVMSMFDTLKQPPTSPIHVNDSLETSGLINTHVQVEDTSRDFFPVYQLSTTKHDQFQKFKNIESSLVGRDVNYLHTNTSSCKLLKYTEFLKTELAFIDNPCAPDLGRLSIYSRLFDMIISDFKTFAPILSEIKVKM
jgi:hypothetical protein